MTPKFYSFSKKIYYSEGAKLSENKVRKIQKFYDQVGSSSKSIGKFL